MLTFKHEADRLRWRALFGYGSLQPSRAQKQVIGWISLFHAYSVTYTGNSAVVTSWFRGDETAHHNGEAVDLRIHGYSPNQRRTMERMALAAGMPIVHVKVGQPDEHWHIGQLATLASEGP
jgi:hypothetical protein